ncbi:MAG: AraC family transcriptional regulator [Gemmatimonadaceae bacterium]
MGVDAIAVRLGLSRQTLFRKHRAEGLSFEGVLEDLRREVAIHCLGPEKASVSETAYRVGYSEPAAFSRAFKRWTGFSPRTYALRAEAS